MSAAFATYVFLLSGLHGIVESPYPDDVAGPVKEVAGKTNLESSKTEVASGLRILTIPAASFSNTFANSNLQPGRILFRPSAGHFTADRSTGAYAVEGFVLEKSGLKLVNIRLHARDNSNQNMLVQVYGITKGTAAKSNVATFGTSGNSTAVRTFDFPVSHTYQGNRYYTVSIWLPNPNCRVYGIEIWYQDTDSATHRRGTRPADHEFTLVGTSSKTFKRGAETNPELRVKLGDTVRVTLTSSGGTHDWTLVYERDGEEVKWIDTPNTNGAAVSTGTFVANRVGEFTYYCAVGSHRQQGMEGKGKFIVEHP